MGCFGKQISVSKFDGTFFCTEVGRTKYSESTLCLKKTCFRRIKITSRQLVANLFFAAPRTEKIVILIPKNLYSPPPFKLNEWSHIYVCFAILMRQSSIWVYTCSKYISGPKTLFKTIYIQFD